MKALAVNNVILYKCENKYYSPSVYDDLYFQRYISVFSSIRIVAKVYQTDDPSNYIPLDTTHIEVVELPPYRGLRQLMGMLPSVIKCYIGIEKGCDCSILKVVQIESIFAVLFGRLKKPYGIEVVNDPKSIDNSHFIQKIVSVVAMKYFMRYAKGVSYITKYVLQRKYPCRGMTKAGEEKGYFYTDYPTIDLFIKNEHPRKYTKPLEQIALLHVANVIVDDSKGQTTVLRVIKELKDKKIEVQGVFLGEGDYVSELKKIAVDLGIEENVAFVGRIANKETLMEYYKDADLFVFPSRNEAQGRVNLEAQSVGLPCLASKVGGIVELFDEDYLFEPHDYKGFANKIMDLMENPKELEEMSRKNIESAKRFEYDSIKGKRANFYQSILRSSLGKI